MAIKSVGINTKLTYLMCTLALALTASSIRLFYLQCILNHVFAVKSQKNFLRYEPIPCLRGNIVDRNGLLLATNRPTTNIYWQGIGNNQLLSEQITLIQSLELILAKPLASQPDLLASISRAERYHKKILLAEDISLEQLSQIAEQFTQEKNIVIDTHFKRCYPHNTFACHLLGYLGRMNLEILGKMGLEKMFEETLKGTKGEKIKTINSLGRNLTETEIRHSAAGQDIQTTLDINLQQIAESIFPAEYTGTFILMDPEDGSILTLVSRPNFDPTIFLDPMTEQEWKALEEKKPFLNRAFNASYPPGSIFKLVTASAALETNLIDVDTSWYCCGYVEFAHRKYWCANRHGHGYLSTTKAIQKSCNTAFFDIGKKISIDVLADYAHRFGLGEKTNILFTEKEGLVPSNSWKKRVKGENWWPGETLSAAIGQSYLLATPIQIARMISAIFTGQLTNPRLLMTEPIVKKTLTIKAETIEILQSSMGKVTDQGGTAQSVKRIKDMKIYAKTSTAQTANLDKRELGGAYLEHAWFAGYFQYKEHKPLTIVILVENIGSSRIATDVAKNFFIAYKKNIDETPA